MPASTGGVTVHLTQNITVNGNSPQEVQKSVLDAYREFEKMMKMYTFDMQRRSFS